MKRVRWTARAYRLAEVAQMLGLTLALCILILGLSFLAGMLEGPIR